RFPDVDLHLTGASGIEDPGAGYVHERPFEVDTTTLDAYCAEHLPGRVDVLKIDAEASEHLVLRGSAGILRRDRPVIFCEALPGRVEREMEAIFREFEYALFNAGPAGVRPVERLEGENLESHDFIVVPRERAPDFASQYVR
ncbi:MAG TPA: FkbM family methyltransferase, partial [Rhodothermales bacterium]